MDGLKRLPSSFNLDALRGLPLIVKYERGDENADSWTVRIERIGPEDLASSAPPQIALIAIFNARAAIKDWEPRG